jgi:hypothetical protein
MEDNIIFPTMEVQQEKAMSPIYYPSPLPSSTEFKDLSLNPREDV